MRLNVANDFGEIDSIEIEHSATVSQLAAAIGVLKGTGPEGQSLYYNGQLLTDSLKTLASLGILPDDIVLARPLPVRPQATAPSAQPGNTTFNDSQIEMTRQQILQNPAMRAQITASNPMMGRVLENPEQFKRMFMEMQRMSAGGGPAGARSVSAADGEDMMDVEIQRRIEAEIRRKNIEENLSNAMEYNPESFGRVVMLYIDMSVNGIPIKAFVDSGAQATIISPQLAEKCGVMHLLDDRFSGTAHGVGTAKILGRIHSAPIRIGSIFLPCSFTVMENKGVEFLFGLDMLRRHQACIDLSKNVLRIGDQEVAFLAEHEISAADRFEDKGEQYAKDGEGAKKSEAPCSSTPGAKPAAQTTAPAPVASSSSTTAPPPVSAKYSEENIKTLTDLGVSRTEAIGALDMCGGNVDMAASMLF